jgi:hypothetical protein
MTERECVNRDNFDILSIAGRNGGRLCWRATSQGIFRRGSSRRWESRGEGTQPPSLSPSTIGLIDPKMPQKTHPKETRKTRSKAVPLCHLARLNGCHTGNPARRVLCGTLTGCEWERPNPIPRVAPSLGGHVHLGRAYPGYLYRRFFKKLRISYAAFGLSCLMVAC